MNFGRQLRIRVPGPVYAGLPPQPAAAGPKPAPAKPAAPPVAPALIQLDLSLQFDIPEIRHAISAQTLIQPDRKPPAADVLLPNVLLWAKKLDRRLGPVSTPGRPELPEPVVAPSNSAMRLPWLGPGEAVQLLSLSPVKAFPDDMFAVPAGSQIGNLPDGGQDGAAETGAPSAALARLFVRALTATRVKHQPNGKFDVVVESSGGGLFPESTFSLSGRPVHAVFLKAGGPKDWIMQYCVPASDAQQTPAGGGVVRLGAPPMVQPPYPRLTFRPPARHGSYLTVHGFVDTGGSFERLRMSGSTDPDELWLVLATLRKWEFRPATVDGRPARVEVLLAIPPE